MVLCEHFSFASYPQIGYRLVKSPGLYSLINRGNVDFLCHVGDYAYEQMDIQVYFPQNKILSFTRVRPLKDEFKRSVTWSNTILVSVENYLELTQPSNIFGPYFLKEIPSLDRVLEPLQIK